MALDERKEKILEEWLAVRNAIIRASDGQLRVTYSRVSDMNEGGEGFPQEDLDKVVGVFIELVLVFPKPLSQDFTSEEKEAVEKAIKGEIDSVK